MGEKYKKIGTIISQSKQPNIKEKLIIIRDERGVCVVSEAEWRVIWGRQNLDRWKRKIQLRN